MGLFTVLILTLFYQVLSRPLLRNSQSNLYQLFLHPKETGALCLDGSPAGLFIHEGSGENRSKFMIHFRGGGFCGGSTLAQTIESCYNRSFTDLGTTTKLPSQISLDGKGVLSTKKEENPIFYDWTKIFVIYCDGATHQGYRESPISYKNRDLYFRGTRNVMTHFKFLESNYDFYNGQKIVITGVSAGGLATYQWANYLQDHTKKAQVLAIPDSGFFITDYYSPIMKQKVVEDRIQNLLRLVLDESEEELPEPVKLCLEETQYADYAHCFNAANYIKYVKPNMLIAESPYDEWSLNFILVVSCLPNQKPTTLSHCNDTTRVAIEQYRMETLNQLKKMRMEKKNLGIWAPACVQHGFSDLNSLIDSNYRAPSSQTGLTLNQAISLFLENPNSPPWLLDESEWPHNSGCSGIRKALIELN